MKLKIGDIIKKDYDEGTIIGKIKSLSLNEINGVYDNYVWATLEIIQCPKELESSVNEYKILVGSFKDELSLLVKKIKDDDELMVELI